MTSVDISKDRVIINTIHKDNFGEPVCKAYKKDEFKKIRVDLLSEVGRRDSFFEIALNANEEENTFVEIKKLHVSKARIDPMNEKIILVEIFMDH